MTTTLSPDSHYDAVIIGGGPSGTSAATILAQHGHKVLIIERDRFRVIAWASR